MKLVFSSSSSRILRGPSTSDSSFPNASYVPTSTIVSLPSVTNSTVKDANVLISASATIDNSATVLCSLGSGATISSASPGVALALSNGKLSRVTDGNVTVQIKNRLWTQQFSIPVSRVVTATTAFSSWITGSLGKHLADSISALLAGKTAPTYTGYSPEIASTTISDIFAANGSRNAGWWGATDLTCIPQSVGANGVLISPRDMLFANHYGASGPTFRDNAGNTYVRAIVASRRVGMTDILVATLSSDVPTSITPAKLLPANWQSYLPQSNYGYSCVFTNQDRRLLIADTQQGSGAGGLNVNHSDDATRSQWFYSVRPGDSGSPAFMLINGGLTAITGWSSVGSGPSYADNIPGINAATAANGSPYIVSTVNLSGFNSYS